MNTIRYLVQSLSQIALGVAFTLGYQHCLAGCVVAFWASVVLILIDLCILKTCSKP